MPLSPGFLFPFIPPPNPPVNVPDVVTDDFTSKSAALSAEEIVPPCPNPSESRLPLYVPPVYKQ